MAEQEQVKRLPQDSPFGQGRRFVVRIHEDVTTFYGNVVVSVGLYEAQEASGTDAKEGDITIWSPDHHARPIWVGLPAYDWSFPDEAQRPIPAHDCIDHLRTGVVAEDDSLYCGVCRQEVFV